MDGHPIADWLLTSRKAQTNPATREPWTQDYLLSRILAATGWRLTRTAYSRWEQGHLKPSRENMSRLVRFWSLMGVAAPDLTPPAPEPAQATETEGTLIAALHRQSAAIESQAAAIAALAAAIAAGQERNEDSAAAILSLVEALGADPMQRAVAASRERGALPVTAG